jgi:hypothetical protein
MKYTEVRSPQWANPENTTIACEVLFPELSEDFMPFGAVASGDSEHTHEIFARCVAGEFGVIAPYVAPPPPPDILGEAALSRLRARRNSKLSSEVDPLVTNPLRWNELSPEKQQEWTEYRQALLDITTTSPTPSYLWDVSTKTYVETDVVWATKPL